MSGSTAGRPSLIRTARLLTDQVRGARPGPLDQARATYIEVMGEPRPLENSERAPALLTAAEQCGDAGNRDLHIDLL